jgi:hypothetical protein
MVNQSSQKSKRVSSAPNVWRWNSIKVKLPARAGTAVRALEQSHHPACMQALRHDKVDKFLISAQSVRSSVRGTLLSSACIFSLLLCRLLCICACNEKRRSAGGSLLRLTKHMRVDLIRLGSATLC